MGLWKPPPSPPTRLEQRRETLSPDSPIRRLRASIDDLYFRVLIRFFSSHVDWLTGTIWGTLVFFLVFILAMLLLNYLGVIDLSSLGREEYQGPH